MIVPEGYVPIGVCRLRLTRRNEYNGYSSQDEVETHLYWHQDCGVAVADIEGHEKWHTGGGAGVLAYISG